MDHTTETIATMERASARSSVGAFPTTMSVVVLGTGRSSTSWVAAAVWKIAWATGPSCNGPIAVPVSITIDQASNLDGVSRW